MSFIECRLTSHQRMTDLLNKETLTEYEEACCSFYHYVLSAKRMNEARLASVNFLFNIIDGDYSDLDKLYEVRLFLECFR